MKKCEDWDSGFCYKPESVYTSACVGQENCCYKQCEMRLVDDLQGDELNDWVVKALGGQEKLMGFTSLYYWKFPDDLFGNPTVTDFNPVGDWKFCGPLIQIFKVELEPWYQNEWSAIIWHKEKLSARDHCVGSTPQEAICRVVVKKMFGDEVKADDKHSS